MGDIYRFSSDTNRLPRKRLASRRVLDGRLTLPVGFLEGMGGSAGVGALV